MLHAFFLILTRNAVLAVLLRVLGGDSRAC